MSEVKVEKIDSHTVRVLYSQPTPFWAKPFVGSEGAILPKHIWEGEDPLTFKSSNPIGTGAYTLASASATALPTT